MEILDEFSCNGKDFVTVKMEDTGDCCVMEVWEYKSLYWSLNGGYKNHKIGMKFDKEVKIIYNE